MKNTGGLADKSAEMISKHREMRNSLSPDKQMKILFNDVSPENPFSHEVADDGKNKHDQEAS
jgi:hypothetical protein